MRRQALRGHLDGYLVAAFIARERMGATQTAATSGKRTATPRASPVHRLEREMLLPATTRENDARRQSAQDPRCVRGYHGDGGCHDQGDDEDSDDASHPPRFGAWTQLQGGRSGFESEEGDPSLGLERLEAVGCSRRSGHRLLAPAERASRALPKPEMYLDCPRVQGRPASRVRDRPGRLAHRGESRNRGIPQAIGRT